MVVPLAGRYVAAVAGALLVLTAWVSAVGTLIVPRPVSSWLTRWVDRIVNGAFRLAAGAIPGYRRRDRVLAAQAAAILIGQLAAWLATSFVGFWLLLWPFEASGLGSAFSTAGSALFTLGFAVPAGGAPSAIVTAAGATGLVIVTLQIAYLPTLYAAFNRRETEVALLNARAGVPSWGPELLARTHYALGSGVSSIDTLPDLYTRWEVWAADVTESHTTCLWSGSAHPGRYRPGSPRCWPCWTPPPCSWRCHPRRRRPYRPGSACGPDSSASTRSPRRWASRCPTNWPCPAESA